ncbi:MAG TPA: hypothetical protein VHG93_23280, partial [Longimicrobium sp.]|nr:hypothetical protein [Longimicrobium sp.]
MSARKMIGATAAAVLLALPLIAVARRGEGMAVGAAVTVAEHAAGNPTAAIDPRDGTGLVAWIATEGGASSVWLARVDGEGRTGAAVRVNDRPGDAAPHEQAPAEVAVGPDGAVFVLWQNNTPVEGRRFHASDLRLAVSEDGGRSFRP